MAGREVTHVTMGRPLTLFPAMITWNPCIATSRQSDTVKAAQVSELLHGTDPEWTSHEWETSVLGHGDALFCYPRVI